MSRYVDGFIIPIKKKNLAKYKKMAALGCKVWMKHGALDYYECISDNINVPYGLPFNKVYKMKSDEVLVFAYIVYKSKAHRLQVNKKVHKDPLMNTGPENVYDMKRFSAGGFKVILKAKKSK